MKYGTTILLATVALLHTAAAQAVLVSSSTSTYLTFRDCVAGASVCDDVSPSTRATAAGLPGEDSAAAAQIDPLDLARGINGSAEITGVGSARLEGNARSGVGKRDSTNSYSLQRYTYSGAGPATLTFAGELAYSLIVPGSNAGVAPFLNTLVAGIEIFTVDDALLDAGSTAFENFTLLNSGYSFAAGYASLASDEIRVAQVTGSDRMSLTATVDVDAGDTIWLRSYLQTPVVNGAAVTASLESGFAEVPEPTVLALLGLGLLGLAGARRLRR